jgi:hypothetical protein
MQVIIREDDGSEVSTSYVPECNRWEFLNRIVEGAWDSRDDYEASEDAFDAPGRHTAWQLMSQCGGTLGVVEADTPKQAVHEWRVRHGQTAAAYDRLYVIGKVIDSKVLLEKVQVHSG